MIKRGCFIALLFSLIFLCGCGKQNSFKYEFDDFFGYYFTDDSFEINKNKLNGLGSKLLDGDLINIYTQKSTGNEETFKESIIIIKKTSDTKLETFAKENIENVDIGGVKFSKGKNITFDCNGDKIDMLYYQGRYGLNQYNIYVSQGFIKVNSEIYVISFASLNEKNRDTFSSAFKDIQCK